MYRNFIPVASLALFLYFLRKYTKTLSSKPETRVVDVMFFGCDNGSKKHGTSDFPYSIRKNIGQINPYIKDAKSSLDICMYLITLEDVVVEILNAHKRGVKVRIITDANMSQTNGSKITTFKNHDIEVRSRNSQSGLMHHKIVIINNEIIISGSANWTMQAISENCDDIFMTSNSNIVKECIEEFNVLWKILEVGEKQTLQCIEDKCIEEVQ